MDLSVRDKGYLVLGGTAGIGLAAARSLAEDPWWYYHMGPGRDARELLSALWRRIN